MKIQSFAERLEKVLKDHGITQDMLAKKAGITPRYVSKIKKSGDDIPESFFRKICTALNMSEEEFLHSDNAVDTEYFPVPLREAAGGMGGGASGGSKRIISYISLRKDFLLTKTTNLDALSFIHAQGDSMAPTIPDGAYVLIDESQTEPANGKIFYVMFNNDLLIKRLAVENGKVVSLISDGWQHKDDICENDDLQILGKAILQQTLL